MRSLHLTEFGERLTWHEAPTPEPQGREVLLETISCGVCHSDLHLWEGYYDLGSGRRSYVKDRGVSLPLTLGHEVVGRVVALGPEAAGAEIGDVRLVYPWIGCRECRQCRAGREHLCATPRSMGVFTHGGYSDHVLVPDVAYLVEIGDLPPESACSYACAGLTAFSALRKVLPLEADEDLVLIGAGGLGLMALHVVRELTSARVIVVDVSATKLEMARSLIDCSTVDASEAPPFEQIRRLTGRGGVAAAVDFVGSSETAALGFSIVAKGGTLVSVGLFGGELTIPTPALPLRAVAIRGSYTGSLTELRELVALARSGGLPPLPVSCHALDDAQEVLERLRSGGVAGRAVLRPNRGTAPAPAERP